MTRISTEGWLPLIRQQLETMTSRSVLFKKLIHPCRGRKGELFLIFLIGGIAIDLNAGPRGEISVLDSMDSMFYISVAFTLKENLILSHLQWNTKHFFEGLRTEHYQTIDHFEQLLATHLSGNINYLTFIAALLDRQRNHQIFLGVAE